MSNIQEQSHDYHIPVMVNEVLQYLVTDPYGVYCDVTAGGGGHSKALLEKFPHITVISSDWDINATKQTKKILESFDTRSQVIYGAFDELDTIIKKAGFKKVNGILADFGTSQNQIINNDGFSFRYDTFLDMRMSKGYTKLLAVDVINNYTEKQLSDIFFTYGEERYSRLIAHAIIVARRQKKIKTTLQLVSIVEEALSNKYTSKNINPATRIFQALRIEVNKELEHIEKFLKKCPECLLPEGRIVTISFHSLEDRLVKQSFKANKNIMKETIKGILKPSPEEIKQNKASRSAIMRVAQKI